MKKLLAVTVFVLGLAALSATTTWQVTRRLRAQTQNPSTLVAGVTIKATDVANTRSVTKLDVAYEGGILNVVGRGSIVTSDLAAKYVWALRVFDPHDKAKPAVFRHVCDQAIFDITGAVPFVSALAKRPMVVKRPQFADSIFLPLAPGEYAVELCLHQIGPDGDTTRVPCPVDGGASEPAAGRRFKLVVN
jgi:hypothetical protein